MTGKSSLSRFRCPDTIFAFTGALGGVVASPFYSKDGWAGSWTPPQPDPPSGSEENWFKSANLLTFSNAHTGESGGFEAANKLFNWKVATALDLRGYADSFTIFCRFSIASAGYSGGVWSHGDGFGLSITPEGSLSIALPFAGKSGESCAVAETIAVEPLPSGVFINSALSWDNSVKGLLFYLQGVKTSGLILPEAAGISESLAAGTLTLGGGGELTVYSWSMFSAALSQDELAALNCGLG